MSTFDFLVSLVTEDKLSVVTAERDALADRVQKLEAAGRRILEVNRDRDASSNDWIEMWKAAIYDLKKLLGVP